MYVKGEECELKNGFWLVRPLIFFCLVRFYCLCVCVCVCVWERERESLTISLMWVGLFLSCQILLCVCVCADGHSMNFWPLMNMIHS